MKVVKNGYSGITLPNYNIGLDYSGAKAKHIFISHAHADHMPKNGKLHVYATPPTADLIRLRGFKGEITTLDFYKTVKFESFQVTFYPAGHILGSAMTYVETDEGNLLYTGDYKNPPSPASEGFHCPDEVDHFITEATFSLPIYKWKSEDILKKNISDFVQNALEKGYTPILLAYNLGKAQELMFLLKDLNHPMQIHGAGYKLCSVYEKFGFSLGNYETYNRETCEGKILIAPSSALGTGFASNVKKKKIAYCSGWASNEARKTQLTIDTLIPISDHIDFFELIELCKKLSPKKTYVTHTPNPKVVQHYLKEAGLKSSFLDLQGDDGE